MQLINYLPLLLLTGLLSCQKPIDVISPDGSIIGADSLKATPTPIGQLMGTPVTKTIGPAGGTMTTADGKISLTFPAGAVSKETTITVQPGENNAPNGVGQAFTISPNITFEQEVTVIYYYQDDEMAGASVDALGIAYQNSRQGWQFSPSVIVDKTKKTAIAKLSKASWWALIAEYKLEPDKATVIPTETKELTLKRWPAYKPGRYGEPAVAPLVLEDANNDVAKLYINGIDWTTTQPKNQAFGFVRQEKQPAKIMYTAPSQKLIEPVIVTVEIKNPGSNAQFLLSSQLTIQYENFLTVDGHAYEGGLTAHGTMVGNDLLGVISATDSAGHLGKLYFTIENFSAGDHLLLPASENKTHTYLIADAGTNKDYSQGVSVYGTCEKAETEKGTIQVVSIQPTVTGYQRVKLLISGRVVTQHEVNRDCQVVKHKTMSVSAGMPIVIQR